MKLHLALVRQHARLLPTPTREFECECHQSSRHSSLPFLVCVLGQKGATRTAKLSLIPLFITRRYQISIQGTTTRLPAYQIGRNTRFAKHRWATTSPQPQPYVVISHLSILFDIVLCNYLCMLCRLHSVYDVMIYRILVICTFVLAEACTVVFCLEPAASSKIPMTTDT